MLKQCLHCRCYFQAEEREIKRGNGKFCCRSHSSSYNTSRRKSTKRDAYCAYCGKTFKKNISKLKSKSKLYFCCREHKDLAQRIGGIKEIQPLHYGKGSVKYRTLAFRKFEHKCNRCEYNKITHILCVHHKDRDRTNNDLDNLEILCPNCHMEEHFSHSDGIWSKQS